MANEVYYSVSGDVRLPATLHVMAEDILHDTAWVRNDPVFTNWGDASGSGSTDHKVPYVGLNAYDSMAAVAEDVAVVNTALTMDSSTVSIARQALMRTISDINHLVDSTGRVNVNGLAMEAVALVDKRFTQLAAATGASFSNIVGTTGVQMVTDDLYDALYQLRSQYNVNPAGWLCMLNAFQMNSLTESVRSEGGAFQWKEEARNLLDAKGAGAQGTFAGVRLWMSDSVPISTGDASGCLIAPGAIGYREASYNMVPGVGFMRIASPLVTEFGRDWGKANSEIVHNWFAGFAIGQDAKGVTITTLGE